MPSWKAAAQQALAFIRWSQFGECRTDGWDGPPPKAHEVEAALRSALESPVEEPVADNPDPYHLSRILHELAGSASMCWEHVDRAGVFQSTQAAEFVAAAIDEIRQRMELAPPQRKPLSGLEVERLLEQVIGSLPAARRLVRAIERAHRIGDGNDVA